MLTTVWRDFDAEVWSKVFTQDFEAEIWSSCSQSIILTAMAGGTQLFEGAHLTGGNMRFCHESSKCRIYTFFVGQIIKDVLLIILGFGSNGPPSNKNCDSNVPFQFWDLNQINLIMCFLRGTFGKNLVTGN